MISQWESQAHLGSLYGIRGQQAVALVWVGFIRILHEHLRLQQLGAIRELVDGHEAAIDGFVPVGLLSQVDIALLVHDVVCSEGQSHFLNEGAVVVAV